MSVDWAQLAQQWIQMKDQPSAAPGGGEPEPPEPEPGTDGGSADGGGGEADMELDDGGREENGTAPGQSHSMGACLLSSTPSHYLQHPVLPQRYPQPLPSATSATPRPQHPALLQTSDTPRPSVCRPALPRGSFPIRVQPFSMYRQCSVELVGCD